MRPKALVICPVDREPPPVERLRDVADITVVRTEDELRAARDGVEILFLNDFRSELLRDVGPGDLRWIHTSSIGVDALLTEEIINSDIVVSTSRDVCERPIAEWVLGVLIMFAKDIVRTIELQRERTWEHRETESVLGRRVLLLGPGPVGREIAGLLRAAGMQVQVVGRRARQDGELGEVRSIDELDDLLPAVDDVVVALPLTESTRGLIDARRLALLGAGGRLVNVGRGAVVVEQDLIEALEGGTLAGAALDVFEQEPLPADHPLWSTPGALVSPHMSGDLIGWKDRVVDRFASNLQRWLTGDELADVVDLKEHGVSRSALTRGG